MTDTQNKVKTIFLSAIDKVPGERRAYLDAACAGDPALRARVDTLLTAHDGADDLLDRPALEHLTEQIPALAKSTKESLDFLDPSQKPGAMGRLGHYDVLEVIGRGGMGIVLRAFDEKLHRVVALKVLSPALSDNAESRQRFIREARAAAAVTHENVVAIYGVEDGPVSYLVMQCIDGITLQEKLDANAALSPRDIARIGVQIAEGLAAAHRQGLIHRDIKPANILIADCGLRIADSNQIRNPQSEIRSVKITDFGLARAVDDVRLTQKGMIAGTPLYMSPEQARGDPVDFRTDLFSLGSVLYALCTGRAPFEADSSIAVIRRVCDDTPRPIRASHPSIPAWLETIIHRLLAKNPADRFGSAAEVAAVLRECLAKLEAGAGPTDLMTIANRGQQFRRSRRLVVIGLAAAVALIAIGTLAYNQWFAGPPDRNEPEPTGPIVLKPAHTLTGHTGEVLAVAISPDGKLLASGGEDRAILLWDLETLKVRATLSGSGGNVVNLAFSPDASGAAGRKLASVTSAVDSCCIRLWDVASGQPAGTLGGAWSGMWGLAWYPDGSRIMCAGWDRALRVWDVKSREQTLAITDVSSRFVRCLAYSARGDLIVTGGSGPTQLWNATTGKEIANFPPEMCPTFLPSGDAVVGWTHGNGRVTICDVPSGKVRASWRAHPGLIEGLAVSPDGRFIVSLGKEGVARLWSTADQSEVAKLVGHRGGIYFAAFTLDGKRLATTGTEDSTVRLWDLPAVCHVSK